MSRPDGAHLAFPFQVAVDGRTATVSALEGHVRDELLQLLLTNLGERTFLLEFGGGVRRLVFEGSSDATAAVAKATIAQALSRWLGQRLTVEELTVVADNATIAVELKYRIAGTSDSRRIRLQRSGG